MGMVNGSGVDDVDLVSVERRSRSGQGLEVGRALQSLFRCGAVVPHETPLPRTRDKAEMRAAGGVAHILNAINIFSLYAHTF